MDPHLSSFALLPLLPPPLLILDCLFPPPPPSSPPPPVLSLALTSSPLLLSIRGPLYLSSPNVFIVAVFSGRVVVAAFVLVSHPLLHGAPRERIDERFTFSPEPTRLHSRARSVLPQFTTLRVAFCAHRCPCAVFPLPSRASFSSMIRIPPLPFPLCAPLELYLQIRSPLALPNISHLASALHRKTFLF